MNLNTLKKWTLLVPSVIVPALYLTGYFYHEGFLVAFGLNNSFFPLSLTEYLMQAFYVILGVLAYLFKTANAHFHYFYYLAGIFMLMGLFMTWFAPHQAQAARALKSHLRQQRFKLIWVPAFMGALGFMAAYLVLSVIVVSIALPGSAYLYGSKEARQKIEQFSGCQNLQTLPDTQRCVEITENRDKRTGLLIARSATHIAIWTGTQVDMIETAGKRILITKGKASRDTAENASVQQ